MCQYTTFLFESSQHPLRCAQILQLRIIIADFVPNVTASHCID